MIIKGDLDRMAEDIGHAGKSQQAGTRSFKLYLTKAGFYLIAVSDHFEVACNLPDFISF